MKLKAEVADFVVREVYDLALVGDEGPFAVYCAEKRDLSSFDAAIRIARAAGVPTDAVRFAGIKDRRACATQLLSVEGGGAVAIDEPGLRVALVGRSPEHVSSERLMGNEFAIVVRDLDEAEAARLDAGLAEIAEHGLPSYFDDQRFGAARAGKGFPARELARGDAGEALRLLVAAPSSLDSPEHAARRAEIERAWGDWDRCLRHARGWHEESVLKHLRERPDDFRAALKLVPRRERLMQLFAWQSHLWNRTLDRVVRARVPEGDRVAIPLETGALTAWRRLAPEAAAAMRGLDLRLPSGRTKPSAADASAALEAVLAEEGVTREQLLGLRGLRGFEMREAERACVLDPEEISLEDPSPDELHPGRLRATVRLRLPRCAYATLVLKRAVG